MKRDGNCESLWQDNSGPDIDVKWSAEADVVIVGGGITGIATALQLQKAGKKCMVLEAQNIGFGTTGGTSAHLNTLLDDPYYQIAKDFGEESSQLMAQLSRNAIEQIKRNIEEYSIDCNFKELPGFLFSETEDEDKELDKILKGLKDVGIEAGYTAEVPSPIPFRKAIRVEKQAQFHPIKYLAGLAAAFKKGGGIIAEECLVSKVTEGEKKCMETETSKGKIESKAIVYATHIPPGVNVLHFTCAPYRSYVMAFKLEDDNYPDGLVYDLEDPYHYFRTEETEEGKLLIAGGEDHKTGHEANTDICFVKLESYVRTYYKVSEVKYKWSSQYFEPADGLAYIGHLPGNAPNVYVATGFGGNGLIYGTAAAEILTDLVASGKNVMADVLTPARIKPIAGFGKMIKEGADVMANFIARKFATEQLEQMAELARGEGKVVNYEGSNIALYKDEHGKLYAVNPSCPHISCSVGWNSAEKSWDCPCHGSRFSFTGEILTGPSQKNLEVIELQ